MNSGLEKQNIRRQLRGWQSAARAELGYWHTLSQNTVLLMQCVYCMFGFEKHFTSIEETFIELYIRCDKYSVANK